MSYNEVNLNNLSVDKARSRNFLTGGSGKIIKVFLKYKADLRAIVRTRIMTKEGEKILDVQNEIKGEEVYYPRCNISRQKGPNTSHTSEIAQQMDYFYFVGGLVVNVTADGQDADSILIDRLTIVYEE